MKEDSSRACSDSERRTRPRLRSLPELHLGQPVGMVPPASVDSPDEAWPVLPRAQSSIVVAVETPDY